MTFDWNTTSRRNRAVRAGAWSVASAPGALRTRRRRVTTCTDEEAAEQPDEEGEDQRGDHYRWSSFTSAGTMSNRSPTMP